MERAADTAAVVAVTALSLLLCYKQNTNRSSKCARAREKNRWLTADLHSYSYYIRRVKVRSDGDDAL